MTDLGLCERCSDDHDHAGPGHGYRCTYPGCACARHSAAPRPLVAGVDVPSSLTHHGAPPIGTLVEAPAIHPGTATAATPRTARVDFIAALRSGRPFRRRAWIATGPVSGDREDLAVALEAHYWIYPRVLMRKSVGDGVITESIFVTLFDGQPRTLMLPDFLADDWESMP